MPGSALTIRYENDAGAEFDPARVEARLFLPSVDPDEVMCVLFLLNCLTAAHTSRCRWCGMPPTPESLASTLSLTSITSGWSPIQLAPPNHPYLQTYVHTLPWTAPPKQRASINGPSFTSEYLIKALHEARRTKSPQEIEWMCKANEITSGAHKRLMQAVASGEVKDENAAEAEFVSYCRRHGCVALLFVSSVTWG